MTLKNANFKLKQIDNDIEMLLSEKELMFIKTQPGVVDTTKEVVDGGLRTDRNLEYAINSSKADKQLNILFSQKANLENWIDKELRILGEYEPLKSKIIKLKEGTSLTWIKIGEATGYSERQCRRIYKEHVDKRDVW